MTDLSTQPCCRQLRYVHDMVTSGPLLVKSDFKQRRPVLSIMSLLFLCLLFSLTATADEYNHVYSDNEDVVLWINTVGPYHNHKEDYAYFSLPFCAGPNNTVNHYHKTEDGVISKSSGLKINFKVDVPSTLYCDVLLSKKKQKALIQAVKNKYWYQMYLDNLSLWGDVGEVEETLNGDNYYIWTHNKFEIGYNGNQIVEVNFTSENKVNLVEVERIRFTYEVIWKNSSIIFQDRVDKCPDTNFFRYRLHPTSLFIIFVMIICSVGLISMFSMRMLQKDLAIHRRGEILMSGMNNQRSAVVS